MRAVLLVLLAGAALADDVILSSGGEINNCRVVYEGPDEIVVDRGGITMRFRRGDVLRIIRGELEEAPARKAPPPAPPPDRAAPPREETPPTRSRKKAARTKRLINELASDDEYVRDVARRELARLGKAAHTELAAAVTDGRYWVRLSAARILKDLRPREATKTLIEALYAAVPEKGRCPSWNGPYVRAVRDALRSTTGKSFGLNPRSQTQGRALKKWAEWWEGSYKGFPPQIGEEELDPESEDYEERLAEARRLELRKRNYARPPTWQPMTP